MWGTFFVVFAAIWALQFVLTHLQVKHYQGKIKEMTRKHQGYLGTGYFKKRFGNGAVMLVVCDEETNIKEAKVMQGLTVFARFKTVKKLIGMTLEETRDLDTLTVKESSALAGAADMIEKEINKKREGNEAWIS
ncbi:DNA-binding transcriptional regulator of glucitol operon [Salibacterium halotolerans]|uniref:DNA-binding transcriptional regulator of glucitol operon n=2 Tax=Salibacterium halotolerans TaxID=1884432 RepID=A0A1I5TE26_9BACI|nr:DNA-binding transcriptional regulator of glucitol operon [Salibacterium halotolerans]